MRGLVIDEFARHRRRRCDRDEPAFLAKREGRNLLLVVTSGPASSDNAVLPPVPRTFHVLASDRSLAQWPAFVIAPIPNRPKLSIMDEHRDRMFFDVYGKGGTTLHFVAAAQNVPRLNGIHGTASARIAANILELHYGLRTDCGLRNYCGLQTLGSSRCVRLIFHDPPS